MQPIATCLEPIDACGADERRDAPRYEMPPLPVFRASDIAARGERARPIGHLRDISRLGMRVASAEPPNFDRPVGLTLMDVRTADTDAGRLPVVARVVWLGAAEDGDGFEWGCEFVAPATSTVLAIDRLIRSALDI